MEHGMLKIATCQFAARRSIQRNAQQIRKFLQQARRAKADIVHFSECTLSLSVGSAGAL